MLKSGHVTWGKCAHCHTNEAVMYATKLCNECYSIWWAEGQKLGAGTQALSDFNKKFFKE